MAGAAFPDIAHFVTGGGVGRGAGVADSHITGWCMRFTGHTRGGGSSGSFVGVDFPYCANVAGLLRHSAVRALQSACRGITRWDLVVLNTLVLFRESDRDFDAGRQTSPVRLSLTGCAQDDPRVGGRGRSLQHAGAAPAAKAALQQQPKAPLPAGGGQQLSHKDLKGIRVSSQWTRARRMPTDPSIGTGKVAEACCSVSQENARHSNSDPPFWFA
jgi:hypothetical protein